MADASNKVMSKDQQFTKTYATFPGSKRYVWNYMEP